MIERCLAIQKILEQVENEDLALTTTGMVSREAFVANDRPGNFYMLGSLGLLSSFGLGLALLRPERWVFVLEGDGSALMSMGTLALIPTEAPRNLVHIILDNEAYESTGGQPSISSARGPGGGGPKLRIPKSPQGPPSGIPGRSPGRLSAKLRPALDPGESIHSAGQGYPPGVPFPH